MIRIPVKENVQYDPGILKVYPPRRFGCFAYGGPFGVSICKIVEIDILRIVWYLTILI
jgi:hypothetical protein